MYQEKITGKYLSFLKDNLQESSLWIKSEDVLVKNPNIITLVKKINTHKLELYVNNQQVFLTKNWNHLVYITINKIQYMAFKKQEHQARLEDDEEHNKPKDFRYEVFRWLDYKSGKVATTNIYHLKAPSGISETSLIMEIRVDAKEIENWLQNNINWEIEDPNTTGVINWINKIINARVWKPSGYDRYYINHL